MIRETLASNLVAMFEQIKVEKAFLDLNRAFAEYYVERMNEPRKSRKRGKDTTKGGYD